MTSDCQKNCACITSKSQVKCEDLQEDLKDWFDDDQYDSDFFDDYWVGGYELYHEL